MGTPAEDVLQRGRERVDLVTTREPPREDMPALAEPEAGGATDELAALAPAPYDAAVARFEARAERARA